jgi:hypothetical protein
VDAGQTLRCMAQMALTRIWHFLCCTHDGHPVYSHRDMGSPHSLKDEYKTLISPHGGYDQEVGHHTYPPLATQRSCCSWFCSSFCHCISCSCCLIFTALWIALLAALVYAKLNVVTHCVLNSQLSYSVPVAETGFPQDWRGIIWMDRSGAFGSSNELLSTPRGSLAMTFGDATYNPSTREAIVPSSSKAWIMENSLRGYLALLFSQAFGIVYTFKFDSNYGSAQIIPGVSPFGGKLGKLDLPTSLLTYRMTIQDRAASNCPPSAAASQTEVAACAKWIWTSSFVDAVPALATLIGKRQFPCFEVVDADGKINQPYFNAFVSFADTESKPEPFTANLLLGLDIGQDDCQAELSSIVSGTR